MKGNVSRETFPTFIMIKSLARLTYDLQRKADAKARVVAKKRGQPDAVHPKPGNSRKKSQVSRAKKPTEASGHSAGDLREVPEEDIISELEGTGGVRFGPASRPGANIRARLSRILKGSGIRVRDVRSWRNTGLSSGEVVPGLLRRQRSGGLPLLTREDFFFIKDLLSHEEDLIGPD